jgi:hypothetical protein
MLQALIDYAQKHRISTLYAAQQGLCKSMRSEGLLSENNYQRLMQIYDKPLVIETPPQPKTPMEVKQQQIIDEKNRLFHSVRDQWDLTHKPGWKDQWIREAEQWGSLPFISSEIPSKKEVKP